MKSQAHDEILDRPDLFQKKHVAHQKLQRSTTLESQINGTGRLLISEKKSTQDILIPATPFIYIQKIFHPPRLFRILFWKHIWKDMLLKSI